MKSILAVGALALVFSGSALAQGGAGSDHTGPGGAGAGVSGTTGAYMPILSGSGTGAGPNAANVHGIATSFSSGAAVTMTMGGQTVTVPAAAAATVGSMLLGNTNSTTAFTSSLAGVVGTSAAATLAQALVIVGASPNYGNLLIAVNAYNAAVAALPAGQQPPAALLAARAALLRMYR